MEGYHTHARYLGEQTESQRQKAVRTQTETDREITVTNSLLRLKLLFVPAVFPSGSISSEGPRVSYMPSSRDGIHDHPGSQSSCKTNGRSNLPAPLGSSWFMPLPCVPTRWELCGQDKDLKGSSSTSRLRQTWKGSSLQHSCIRE
jgi:hypothetical protein